MADDRQELLTRMERDQNNDAEDERNRDTDTDTDPDVAPLPLYLRLMLSSELLGHEASVSFKDIYAVPNLQTLGMPMSIVSLTGLISGPMAIILLPLLGWFSDTGTNSTRRRICVLILTTLILILGTITVITANNLSTRFCQPVQDTSGHVFSEMENSSSDITSSICCTNDLTCSIGGLQSEHDLTPSVIIMSTSSQDLQATFRIESSPMLSSTVESSTMPTSSSESSERIALAIKSSVEATFVIRSVDGTTSTKGLSETVPIDSIARPTSTIQYSSRAVLTANPVMDTSLVESLYGTTSLTESPSRATTTIESLYSSRSSVEYSQQPTSMTESLYSTTSSKEYSPRATSKTESIYSTTSSKEYSPRATSKTESIYSTTSSKEYFPRATSKTESIYSTTSSKEYSPRATSKTESIYSTTSSKEYSPRATSKTESIYSTASSKEYSPRATSMTESMYSTTSTIESSLRAVSTTESIYSTTSSIESSLRVTSMTESIYRTTSSIESSPRATSTTESIYSTTSSKEYSPRSKSTTESIYSTTSSKEYSPRATSTTESIYSTTSSKEYSPRSKSTTSSKESSSRATSRTESLYSTTSTIESSQQPTSTIQSLFSTTSLIESSPRVTSTTNSPEKATFMDTSSESSQCSRVVSGIAMFGYIVIEVGFQTLTSIIRTWMLMCSPPSAPTPTLVAGLVMTSLGGMLTSGLSMVDLASMLNLPGGSQSGLTAQISIQAIVNIIAVVIGLSLSIPTGFRQLKLRTKHQRHQHQLDTTLIHTDPDITADFPDNSAGSLNPTESTLSGEASPDSGLTVSRDSPTEMSHPASPTCSQNFEEVLVGSFSDAQHHSSSRSTQSPATYGAIEKETGLSNSETTSKTSHTGGRQDSSRENLLTERSTQWICSCRRNWSPKVFMAIMVCSSYFTFGAIVVNKLTLSDFVGKVIFGGDPAAPSGTEEQERYQQGLRASSYGFLLFYACYLAFSFVQKHVLTCMGYTLEFVTVTLAMGVCLVLLSVTERLELYFLLSAVSGVQRAVFNVVFVAVVSDLVHAEAKRRGDGKGPRLGLGVSVMFATLPLAYCTLYPWVGVVVDMSGVPATPLLLAAACSVVASALFCILGY